MSTRSRRGREMVQTMRACHALEGQSSCALLDLPEELLHAILSWSVDSCSANALLQTCRHLHRLRTNPSAMALLVVQGDSRGHNAESLVQSYGDDAALNRAVMQAIITLLQAHPGSRASWCLLCSLFAAAAKANDVCALKQLLTVPGAKDGCRSHSDILYRCIESGHLASVQCLLEAGVEISQEHGILLYRASTHCAAALPLLLDHFPASTMKEPLLNALTSAVILDNVQAASLLLDHIDSSGDIAECYLVAVNRGRPDVLRLLVKHPCSTLRSFYYAFTCAIFMRRVDCAAVMIEAGADVNWVADQHDIPILARAVYRRGDGGPPPAVPVNPHDGVVPMVQLLLHHGAQVTELVLRTAELGGDLEVLRLLREAAAA